MSAATVSPVRLTWLHLRYQFLETVRIPIAVLGNLLFPALSMFFFVVPQEQVARNPVVATMAVAGLGLFAVLSASLFTYGLGVAEDRQLPFDPFVRSLPAGPGPRMVARIGNGAIFSLFGLVPLVLIGWLFTDASVTAVQLVAGVGTILVASVPFVLLGMAVGYSLSAKAALPVLLGWTALFAALAVAAYRRDEGRRFCGTTSRRGGVSRRGGAAASCSPRAPTTPPWPRPRSSG